MHFSRAISLINTPGVIAERAQLARGRLAGKGWTSEMKRAVPAVTAMILMLLVGALLHHQFQPLAENSLFWGAIATVLIAGLGLMIDGDRSARALAMAKLSLSWADVDAQHQAQHLGTTALALLSSLLAAGAIPAIAKQKCDFSPPATPGGRAIAHLCLTPRLAQRPHAAA